MCADALLLSESYGTAESLGNTALSSVYMVKVLDHYP